MVRPLVAISWNLLFTIITQIASGITQSWIIQIGWLFADILYKISEKTQPIALLYVV
jgi:hypothetical protein